MPFCHLDLIAIPAEIPSDPDGTPAAFTLTALEEAMLREDIGLVTALFEAGLDPMVLNEQEINKRPYRALLRMGKEPSVAMVDTLLDTLAGWPWWQTQRSLRPKGLQRPNRHGCAPVCSAAGRPALGVSRDTPGATLGSRLNQGGPPRDTEPIATPHPRSTP